MKRTRKVFGAMAFAVWTMITAFLLCPMAHADPQSMDEQYLALLNRDGIGSSTGITAMIASGHAVCADRMQGYTEDQTIHMVYVNSPLNQSLSAAVVRDAEQVYCPGYLSLSGPNV